jgi:SAM-dependent methyltransferase
LDLDRTGPTVRGWARICTQSLEEYSHDQGNPSRMLSLLRKSSSLRKCVFELDIKISKLIDKSLNIDTVSLPTEAITRITQFDDPIIYRAVPYSKLWKYIRWLKPQRNDVVFDIGCGMGRVLCCFALKPMKKCVGIEVSEILAERAEQNTLSLKNRKCPVEIRVCDAVNACYSDGTIYCLYNPFGVKTLKSVLESIRRSVIESPRHIWIVYFNPVHEDLLLSSSWLECRKHEKFSLTERGRVRVFTNIDSTT